MKIQIKKETDNGSKTPYDELLKSPQWTRKRRIIIERDYDKCLNCRSHKNLQVHHRQYRYNSVLGQFVNPWEYDNKFLITLCESCHKTGHELYKIPVIKINK